jgi:hypothetical protein
LQRDDDVPGGFAPTVLLTLSTLRPDTLLMYTVEIKQAGAPRCGEEVVKQQVERE